VFNVAVIALVPSLSAAHCTSHSMLLSDLQTPSPCFQTWRYRLVQGHRNTSWDGKQPTDRS